MEVFLNARLRRTFKIWVPRARADLAVHGPGGPLRFLTGVSGVWATIWLWFRGNTFAPLWLSRPLRHPLIGYLAASGVALSGVSGTLLLAPHFPIFALAGTLTTMGIVAVGLNWGAGPSLLTTLVATTLTAVFVEPLYLEHFARGVPGSACAALFLLTGFGISLIASQSGSARRKAEAMSCSLR